MASCCTPSTMWLKSDQTPEFLRSVILGLLGPYLVAAMCTFRCSVALFNVLHENCCISLNTGLSCENMKIALFPPPHRSLKLHISQVQKDILCTHMRTQPSYASQHTQMISCHGSGDLRANSSWDFLPSVCNTQQRWHSAGTERSWELWRGDHRGDLCTRCTTHAFYSPAAHVGHVLW